MVHSLSCVVGMVEDGALFSGCCFVFDYRSNASNHYSSSEISVS